MKLSAKSVEDARIRAARAETRQAWAWEHLHETAAERDLLIYALSRVYPAHLMRHQSDRPGHRRQSTRRIVCIHTPAGQLAWHLPNDILPLFAHLQETRNDWDGHTAKDRQMRLFQLPLDIRSSPVVSATPASK